jgi:hypothetical protein
MLSESPGSTPGLATGTSLNRCFLASFFIADEDGADEAAAATSDGAVLDDDAADGAAAASSEGAVPDGDAADEAHPGGGLLPGQSVELIISVGPHFPFSSLPTAHRSGRFV